MYDVFFISYEEPNADVNWEKLKSRVKIAKRVHGIKGISNAHHACAERALTRMFWTVDGDTVPDDDFDFDYKPSVYDENYLHLWYSRNPVNDLTYGYGSIKLWPKSAVLEFDGNWLDFTTTVGNIKIMPEVVATTYFNTSPYDSWKSAFRECIKLSYNVSRGDHVESLDRLGVWLTTTNNCEFADYSLYGARAAVKFFIENNTNVPALQLINDFEWLKKLWSDIGEQQATTVPFNIDRMLTNLTVL